MIRFMMSLYYHITITVSQFTLYQTDTTLMMSAFGYDCFYYRENAIFDGSTNIIPFCLRPETLEHLNIQEKSCYGKQLSFQELKTNNVSPNDLFWWNAPIEIIELYGKYLVSNNLIDDNDQYYCNCSTLSRFGKFCQYDMGTDHTKRSFSDLIWISGYASSNRNNHNDYLTCYVGIQCETNLFCLDWRQICNGVVDCDHGEDEPFDLCSQIESNECDREKEFRCQNGMCIPISIAYNHNGVCFDRTDRSPNARSLNYFFHLCREYPSTECDGINHGWKQFSCNNGQYISYSDLTSRAGIEDRRCANDHNLKYLRRLFSVNDESECWKAMICLTGFDYLYTYVNCSLRNITKNIEEFCPNEFYFPANSVVYSFVFFLYSKRNHVNWVDSPSPDYICYKNEYCQINSFTTVSNNNLRCFVANYTIFSWKNFYEHIIYLFSPCFNTFTFTGVNHQMFYRCDLSNTYISIYRVKDKRKDCYFNEDEHSNIDLCSLKTTNQFKCLTNSKECFHELSINDHEYDCLDGSDEYFYSVQCWYNSKSCHSISWSKQSLHQIYRFNELCDNIINRHLFSLDSNETDETDCEYWSYTCNSVYTQCNGVWNCRNGRDELTCGGRHYNDIIRNALRCKTNEYYCIRLINNYTELNASCIGISRAGDDIIDCIGGTDEQLTSPCLNNYPYDFKRRFLCMNTTVCITVDQVCDKNIDCPYGDDEQICPWLIQNSSSTFSCNSTLQHSVARCDFSANNNQYCRMREHLWFCDLLFNSQLTHSRNNIAYEQYPPHDQSIKSISMENLNSNQIMKSKRRIFTLFDTDKELSQCNLGYTIRSSKVKNRSYCFCPPSYYGDNCQYQSEHLIASFKIQIAYPMNKSTVFRLIFYLFNKHNRIVSHEETVYDLEKIAINELYIAHLMYERVTNVSLHQRSKSRTVRVDSYIIKQTSVHYITSWLFHVSFPFLPVNKLVAEVFLRNESFRIVNCNKRCGSHGKCMYYINMRHVEYCWCEQGWLGDRCEIKSSSDLCNLTSCATHSQCVILNEEKKQMKCICPLGRSGDQCYIKYNPCENVQCENNGTCLPLDQRKQQFSCVCEDGYIGPYCEEFEEYSSIFIAANVTHLSIIPAIIVISDSPYTNILLQSHRVLYDNIALPTMLKITGRPQFRFVQIFHNFSNSFYYAVLIRDINDRIPIINTSVITKNRCKNVSEIFNRTILEDYSYLKRLKLYHLPCQEDHDLRCFFDEYRMCLCTKRHNSDCYFFNHEHGNCDYCKNGGLCLRQDSNINKWTYTCLCKQCSYGSLCQFSPGSYSITFDILIGTEIQVGNISFNEQSTIVHITLIILVIIVTFSLIFNTISIFVFSNKKIRQVGCDLYLLNLAIVAEIGLVLLFLRFLYMIMVRTYVVENLSFVRVSCVSLEYLLRLVPSVFDWLTACISMERTYTIMKDVHFTRIVAAKSLKISRWILLIVYIMNILTTLHRPFYLTLIDEPSFDNEPQGHPWCVLDFDGTSWNVYEKVINVFHLILPFILNLLSIIFFLLNKTNFELASAIRTKKASRFVIAKEQLLKYQSLLIGTTSIITLEIPRLILTFTLACIEKTWQRYIYLIGYLISFLPLAGLVFIYIKPSPKYKKEFKTIVDKLWSLLLCRQVSK